MRTVTHSKQIRWERKEFCHCSRSQFLKRLSRSLSKVTDWSLTKFLFYICAPSVVWQELETSWLAGRIYFPVTRDIYFPQLCQCFMALLALCRFSLSRFWMRERSVLLLWVAGRGVWRGGALVCVYVCAHTCTIENLQGVVCSQFSFRKTP